jgi:hypothetical protein
VLASTEGGAGQNNRKSRTPNRSGKRRGQDGRLEWRTPQVREVFVKDGRSEIYSLVTTTDVALLATLIHDAIGHLMNAIHRAAQARQPLDRIADAMEQTAETMKTAASREVCSLCACHSPIGKPGAL